MLRWLTAGESHGEALVGIIEGVPAGVELTTGMIQDALARRRLGYGRGARMKFEQDRVRILGGVRHGLTQGGPVAIEIANTEWPKWQDVMSSDPVDPAVLELRPDYRVMLVVIDGLTPASGSQTTSAADELIASDAGMSAMCATLAVTSSPTCPSPRVAARTRRPFS